MKSRRDYSARALTLPRLGFTEIPAKAQGELTVNGLK